jgi:hypothetical protein
MAKAASRLASFLAKHNVGRLPIALDALPLHRRPCRPPPLPSAGTREHFEATLGLTNARIPDRTASAGRRLHATPPPAGPNGVACCSCRGYSPGDSVLTVTAFGSSSSTAGAVVIPAGRRPLPPGRISTADCGPVAHGVRQLRLPYWSRVIKAAHSLATRRSHSD